MIMAHMGEAVSIAFRLKEWHGGARPAPRCISGSPVSIAFRLKEWHGACPSRLLKKHLGRSVSIAFRLKEWHGGAARPAQKIAPGVASQSPFG